MNTKKSSAYYVSRAGIIAAVYAVTTVLQNFIIPGSASFAVQIRISEALSVLCLLTPSAIPGLALGCALSDIIGLGALPFDAVFGSAATLLSGIFMYRLRNIRIKNLPLLSCCMPVIFNALFVGAELAVFMPLENKSRFVSCIIQFLLVAAGESIAVFLLGLPLLKALEKRKLFS